MAFCSYSLNKGPEFLFCTGPCKWCSQPHLDCSPEVIEPRTALCQEGWASVRQLLLGNKLANSEMNWGSCVLMQWPVTGLLCQPQCNCRPPTCGLCSELWLSASSHPPFLSSVSFPSLMGICTPLGTWHGENWIPIDGTQHRTHYIFVIETPTASFSTFPSEYCLVTPGQIPRRGHFTKPGRSLGDALKPCRLEAKLKEKKSQPCREEPGDGCCISWCSTVLCWPGQDMAPLARPSPSDCFISFHTKHICQLP